MEWLISLLSVLGINGLLLFFVQRHFSRRDKREAATQAQKDKEANEAEAKRDEFYGRIEVALETLRLLAYHRMSQEIERLLDQGYATPAERRVLDEMYANYKDHGWNGDMDARLEKVYVLRTDHTSA